MTKTHFQTKPQYLPLDAFVLARYDGTRLHVVGAMSSLEAESRLKLLTPDERALTCTLPVDFRVRTADLVAKLSDAYDARSESLQAEFDRLARESN